MNSTIPAASHPNAPEQAAPALRAVDPAAPNPECDVLDLISAAGVPGRYAEASLDRFEPRQGTAKALEAAKRIAAAVEPASALFMGGPGSGKTHLGAGIVRGRAERLVADYPEVAGMRPSVTYTPAGEPVEGEMVYVHRPQFRTRFVIVPELLDALRHRINHSGAPDPLEPLMRAPLVILDDLGREKVTDWVLDRLYVLINARYNDLLPTVVTTNYALNELAERGYDAMVSRLIEDAEAIKLTAPDYRRSKT